jgi:hypothetical protein
MGIVDLFGTGGIHNLHQLVKDKETDVDALRKRDDVMTNRVFEFVLTLGVLPSQLRHNRVRNDVASAFDHREVGDVEDNGKRV